MGAIRTIAIERFEPHFIGKFGKPLSFSGLQPTSTGEWWKCWEGCAELSAGRQWVGFVQAAAGTPLISEMEREPGSEMIIPVSGRIVQVVALSNPAGQTVARPDASTARAFLMEPGEALVIAPGVWHAAAFGFGADASYFYIAERRRAEQSEGRLGWVEISGGELLQPVMQCGSPVSEVKSC